MGDHQQRDCCVEVTLKLAIRCGCLAVCSVREGERESWRRGESERVVLEKREERERDSLRQER